MTTTVADTARILDVLAGPDDRDRTSLPAPLVRYEDTLESTDVRGLSAEALGGIGKQAQAALPALDHLMKTDRDPGVRTFASAAYYRIGSD